MPDQEATLTANYHEGGISLGTPIDIQERNATVTIIINLEEVKLNTGQIITIENFDSINLWKTAEDIEASDFDVSTSQGGANINKTLSSGELELEVADNDIEAGETVTVIINQSGASNFWIGDSNESSEFSVQRSDTEVSDRFTFNIDTPAYSLRDIGPAGGHIFYIDEDDEHEWKYLEAAPEETEGPTTMWGSTDQVDGTEEPIGTGRNNTRLILESDNSGWAADRADDLNHGGYSDWFLPSMDELSEMYTVLHEEGYGGFTNSFYWSSRDSDHTAGSARGVNFSGGTTHSYSKMNSHRVRAIRSF